MKIPDNIIIKNIVINHFHIIHNVCNIPCGLLKSILFHEIESIDAVNLLSNISFCELSFATCTFHSVSVCIHIFNVSFTAITLLSK